MRIIDKIALVYIKEGKVLFLRSQGRDVFYFPGGKRISGESDLEALTRELKEEMGVRLSPETAVFLTELRAPAHGQSDPAEVVCRFYAGEFVGEIVPQSEIEEIAWLEPGDSTLTPLATKLMAFLRKESLIG